MRPLELAILATLFVVILFLSDSQSAPYQDYDVLGQQDEKEVDDETLARWFQNHLDVIRRNRRTKLDAGFNSRHDVLHKYFQAEDAAQHADDPYGPGRRK